MTVTVATLNTRVILIVGDSDPMEVATLPIKLIASRPGPGAALNSRRWYLSLALGFLRIGVGPPRPCEAAEHPHTDRQKFQGRPGAAHLPRG